MILKLKCINSLYVFAPKATAIKGNCPFLSKQEAALLRTPVPNYNASVLK